MTVVMDWNRWRDGWRVFDAIEMDFRTDQNIGRNVQNIGGVTA